MKNLMIRSAAGVLVFTLLAHADDKPATDPASTPAKSVLTGPMPAPNTPGDSRGFSGKRQVGRGNPILNAVREMELPSETHDKIIAIFAEQEAQNRKNREQSEPKRKELEEKMQAAREKQDQEAMRKLGEEMRPFYAGVRPDSAQTIEKVNALLTPEQQAKLKEILDKQPKPQGFGGQMGRGGPGGPGSPGGPMGRGPGGPGFDPRQLVEALSLNEEQQGKTREIMSAYGEQMRGYFQSNGEKMRDAVQRMMQAREKKDEAAIEQVKKELTELQKNSPQFPFDKIEAILSAEQKEKFKPLAEKMKEDMARRAADRMNGNFNPRGGPGSPGTPGTPGSPNGSRPEGGRRPGSPGSPGSEGNKSKLDL